MPIANITLDCVNGISKQDAETLKGLPGVLDALNERVTALEDDAGKTVDWELFTGTDWSEFSTDGKANQQVMLKITVVPPVRGTSSDNYDGVPVSEYRTIYKGDTFSNTDIVESYRHSITEIGTSYPSGSSTVRIFGVGSVSINTSGLSGNTALLTSSTVQVRVNIADTGKSDTGTGTGRAVGSSSTAFFQSVTESLTKNGTGTAKIELYYRPKE